VPEAQPFALRESDMHIARVRHEGPDGAQARVAVFATAQAGTWVDVRAAERRRLERAGAAARAARRVAEAAAPGSLGAALEAGDVLLEDASSCGSALVTEPVPLVAAIDPPVYRDFMAFEEHAVNASARLERAVQAPARGDRREARAGAGAPTS